MPPKTESNSLEGDAATHGLRKNVRYITGLDTAGNSVILASPSLRFHDRGGYAIAAVYSLEKVPANIENNSDITYYMASQEPTHANQHSPTSFQLVIPGGANFVQGDFGPSACSAWHRTLSVDFVTVVQGELVLEVGDDFANASQVSLQTGDSIVQRGSMHRWLNPSSKAPARFVATLLASVPCKVGDRIIQPTWYSGKLPSLESK